MTGAARAGPPHQPAMRGFTIGGPRATDSHCCASCSPTMHRVLTPADYRHTTWKNGGGRTTEIAAYPPDAGLEHFAWRASIADIERSGPFSAFAGIDRTLVLLQGP